MCGSKSVIAYLGTWRWLVLRTFVIVSWIIDVSAAAQAPALYFEKITVENGLSHNKVNCIMQDHRGFIWIGTDDGLNRFDGRSFEIFRHEAGNPQSISGNRISDMLEDENGIIWISTLDGGIASYNYRSPAESQFRQYKHTSGDTTLIPTNSVNALLLDSYGNLWIATNGFSALRFDKETGLFASPDITKGRVALALCEDDDQTIWVGRQGGSIMKVDPVTLQYETDSRYDDLYADLPHAEVSSLYCDSEGNVWFGSWDNKLYRYNSHTFEEETFVGKSDPKSFLNDEILCLAEDHEGYLWMGGRTKGLQLYEKSTQHFYHYRHNPFQDGTVADDRINCLFLDKDGKMWVGTDKGISVSDPLRQQFRQTFIPPVGQEPSIIYSLHEDENETLWLGTNNGLFFRKSEADTFIHRPLFYDERPLAITSFFKDDDRLYLGTDYSLFSYDISKDMLEIMPNTHYDQVMNGLIESRITSIVKDTIEGSPVLLMSPYGHYLTYYDLEREHWISRLDSAKNVISAFQLKDHLIRKFYKTSTGKIWLANTIGGLGEWIKDPSPYVKYHTADLSRDRGLLNNYVYDVVEGKDGNLWISTFGGGLHYWLKETGEIKHVSGSPNLIEGLQVDEAGNVFMISNGKLHRYDPGTQWFSSVKLPDQEKTGGVNGYMLKDKSGKLYVSGKNYFICFDPETMSTTTSSNTVLLTDFRIYNVSHSHLLHEGPIRLPYRQNAVSFNFIVPNFSFSTPTGYLYQLEDVDKDWVHAGSHNTASYTNLKGGDYVFRVKTDENTGRDEEAVTEVYFTITPPFWVTWWFYGLCTIIIASIGYSVYRYRVNGLLKLQAIRNRIAQDLHDNIGSALSSILIYSEVAQNFQGDRQQASLIKVLGKISETSNNIISEMSDIVWAINPHNDNMANILQRMESFAVSLALAKQIALDFSYDEALLGVNLEMEKRKNFYLIFKEAFTNAISMLKQNISKSKWRLKKIRPWETCSRKLSCWFRMMAKGLICSSNCCTALKVYPATV
jgi:ligand-binding sensor domain-containing protein